MAKAERILNTFPAFYRSGDVTKLLADVVRSLAQPLEEADTLLFRIQRAHRIKVAEHADDIIQLAAALNLTAFHFEDILTGDFKDYEQKLDLMRTRVQRLAQIHLRGTGTPWAVMEAAAAFLNATLVADEPGQPVIKHVDAEGYSQRATIEYTHLPERPRQQIYLHENPLRRSKVEPAARWQMNSWTMHSRNVEPASLRFVVQGVSEHTVRPSVFCPALAEGWWFNGAIPAGSMLVVGSDGALLDGQPVDDWLIHFKGGLNDFAVTEGSFTVGVELPLDDPFDGNLATLASLPYQRRSSVPSAPIGTSKWFFKVADGIYDGGDFDYAVYATHPDPVGLFDGDFNFGSCVFDYPAGGIVGMSWDERIPCAFKLLLPAQLPTATGSAEKRAPTNHLSRVSAVLPRFKAAGVRAYVDAAREGWVLGQSVIRNAAAQQGDGVQLHVTRLLNQKADLLAPMDDTSI